VIIRGRIADPYLSPKDARALIGQHRWPAWAHERPSVKARRDPRDIARCLDCGKVWDDVLDYRLQCLPPGYVHPAPKRPRSFL